jgi:hypothetical protein
MTAAAAASFRSPSAFFMDRSLELRVLDGTHVPDETLHLSLNLQALQGTLNRNVQRVSHFVATALIADTASLTEPLQGHGRVVTYSYQPGLQWTEPSAAAEYRIWALLNGFRDLAEVATYFLQSVHSLCIAAKLSELQARKGHVTGADWQDMVVTAENRFEKANLPQKLERLTRDYELRLANDVITQIASLYAVRNCLVHRAGVVQEQDISSNGVLRASWISLVPYVVTEDGEQRLKFPHYMEKAGHIAIKRELIHKDFPTKQCIAFTSEEFHEIAHSLYLVGIDVATALERRLREAGIPVSELVPPSA